MKLKILLSGLMFLFQLMGSLGFAGTPQQDELFLAIASDNEPNVQAILSDSAKRLHISLNERRDDGWNMLSIAIARGNPVIVTALLDAGAALSSGMYHEGREYSPFVLAVQNYRQDAPRVLDILFEKLTPSDFDREIKALILRNGTVAATYP